jgi:hypothetical protein
MRCVLARDFTVVKVLRWRHALFDDPPYQRESAVWSLDRQQLFIDSLLNGYDVPKIYLHDLRGQHPTRVYALVDGKQRVTTIWRFLRDEFPLSPRFKVEEANLPPELPPGTPPPGAGMRFSEMDPAWREVLERTYLSVVLIQNATEEDIEELFSRLNNGEPLNAAEKRNARGGDMAGLIRELAKRPFFTERLRFSNARYHHLDLAARLLLIEQSLGGGEAAEAALAVEAAGAAGAALPDLRSRALDRFVEANRRLADGDRAGLLGRTERVLTFMERAFTGADPLLATQSTPPLYYLFARPFALAGDRAASPGELRKFLEWFQAERRADLNRPEDRRDHALTEFSELTQRGGLERHGLERRLEILAARFRDRHPEVLTPAGR